MCQKCKVLLKFNYPKFYTYTFSLLLIFQGSSEPLAVEFDMRSVMPKGKSAERDFA